MVVDFLIARVTDLEAGDVVGIRHWRMEETSGPSCFRRLGTLNVDRFKSEESIGVAICLAPCAVTLQELYVRTSCYLANNGCLPC